MNNEQDECNTAKENTIIESVLGVIESELHRYDKLNITTSQILSRLRQPSPDGQGESDEPHDPTIHGRLNLIAARITAANDGLLENNKEFERYI